MIDDLKEHLGREPSAPFCILVTGGHAYEASRPHQIAIGQMQMDYYFPRSDRKATVRLNRIVAFETLENSRP